MRLLIFLLALTSAFFVSAEPDMDDLVSPKQVSTGTCGLVTDINSIINDSDGDSCVEYITGLLESDPSIKRIDNIWLDGEAVMFSGKTSYETTFRVGLFRVNSSTPTCPPDTNPNHIISVGEGESLMCAKELAPQDCPAGYHSLAVSKALGSSDCMPKECPPAGTGENLASTPMTGGVPFSGGGMYCNDGCAYSVNADQITSDKYAVGTSQGAACGDKPYDNKKLADEGDTGECSVSSGDVPLLSCPNANPTTPEKDPHNNDDSKTPEDETPEKPKETCAEGDAACNLKNVETEIENSTNKQIDNDNKLHNKKIDADTKNTNALLNILESIDTSILLQTQQDDRLHAVTVSKFNELVDAVNGIETGGSGGGGGGNGSGTGDDCEGDPSDCVPIEGSEIPSETVNLNQYADKYDDWLPNAELPSEKCIVISTGRSLCLSFESFILLFQSISGLMVIAALMHSARIISGAI
ncbi:hypothetical protein [Pseudoalteromonas sp. BSi20439]|uniref:hypothetical protein n=1 Tax=Pseudoalteromonas sp. BSi20439 TaxID=420915 RepID=UPI000231A825|nr:hypothetical protein [Pseudoalteromonas sp. BSi20439]GAA70756.1 hypothetical protein P20439_0823 [Pseudoalteromonas sp. BSi20439]